MNTLSVHSARKLLYCSPGAVALLALASGCYSTGGFVESAGDAAAVGVADDGGSNSDGPGPAASTGGSGAALPRGDAGSGGTTGGTGGRQAGTGGSQVGTGGTSSGTGGTSAGTGGRVGGGTGGATAGSGGSPGATGGATSAYTLVFADEFDGASLDRSKWCTRYVYPGGPKLQVADDACTGPTRTAGTLDYLNDEQQRYVDYNTSGEIMHVQGGGTLALRATKTRSDTAAPYEAAMIRSKMEFKPTSTTSYYVVARLRLPDVIGTWPSLWLNSGFGTNAQTQWPPEIDIFEGALNGVEDTNNMLRMGSQVRGLQTPSMKQEITYSKSYNSMYDDYYASASLRGVWVNIAATWSAGAVCYYVNGTNTMCENYQWNGNSGSAANPAHLLLNLAIGGSWAGRHGIADADFPATFEADWIHVYTFVGSTAPSPLPN